MKHYLDLISISAKQRRKENRMTQLCILLSVFLVTVIFAMADMEMRAQLLQAIKTDGSWHAGFVLDEEQATLLQARPELSASAPYGTLNYRLKDHYQIEHNETVICGLDPELLDMFPDVEIYEGTFPSGPDGAVLNETAKNHLGIELGSRISLSTPQGRVLDFQVTGFSRDTALTAEQDAFGMFLNLEGFFPLYPEGADMDQEIIYLVTFRPFCNIPKAIREISVQFGLEEKQVRQNVKVLALMFQSRDSYMMRFYFTAAILALLVVTSGILMITASMNSGVARRTKFFGMLRCLGAEQKQIIRLVRREAFVWCRTAIPAGIFAGTVVVWGLCAMLRFLSPELFEGLPVFGISPLSIAAGTVLGFLTVFLASQAPAKRASRVSPLTAVSGNAATPAPPKHLQKNLLNFLKAETALGIHHAAGSKRNYFLVTGSFAFSIILFLAFSTAIDFMNHAITPLRPSAPDLTVYTEDISNSIPPELMKRIQSHPKVKRAFGRSYGRQRVWTKGQNQEITVLSYDDQQFQWSRSDLLHGSLSETASGKGVLAVYRKDLTFPEGSSIQIETDRGRQEFPVTGILGDVPYSYGKNKSTDSTEELLICSEKLFQQLFGETHYAVMDIQLHADAKDSDVQEIREIVSQKCGENISFSDRRIRNRETKGAAYSMAVFLYGFLAVIALISFFNIINCMAMSVSARMGEYGMMRAVGMSVDQLTRMIIGEALTYAISGVILGCLVGLPVNHLLFRSLVTFRWGDSWKLPGWELLVILAVIFVSVCLAVAEPSRRIREMSIVDTIAAS